MEFVSRSNPDQQFNPSLQKPSCKKEGEYQRLLHVFDVVVRAVRQKTFTSKHTINIDDIRILEDRFFGVSPYRFLGTETSIKRVCHDGAPDIVMVQRGFALAIDHFRLDCTKWTRSGSPFQKLLSNQGSQVRSLSGDALFRFLRSEGIRCSEECGMENLHRMIKAKVKKIDGYFDALDCYLSEEDRSFQKELWLFVEDVLSIVDVDCVAMEASRQLETYSNVAGMIYARDAVPSILSNDINDIRFIYNKELSQ